MSAMAEKGEGFYVEKKSGDRAHDEETALIEAAMARADEETRIGIKAIFRLYWRGAMWSMLLSLALVMEGMDVGLVNNFFGQQAYIERFGHVDAKGKKFIPANWQAAINNGQQIGAVAGLLFNGWAQSKYGSKKVYMLAMVLLAAFVFILVFATSLPMLFVGNMICGFPWGIFQTLTTAYAAEICPMAMRGYLTSWVSMCWGTGSFLAAGVLRASLGLPGNWAWRVPYMLQWIWPVPLFFVGMFAPESPWYLIRVGRIEDAEVSLRRLAANNFYTEQTMRETIAMMKHTNEKEKEDAKKGSFLECFKGVNLRRTELACMIFAIQVLSGQGICAYATTFLRNAGMAQTMAFNYSMAIQSTNILATGTAVYLMGRLNRRTFYLFGTTTICVAQVVIGILGVVGGTNVAAGIAGMMIVINLGFKLSLGPACYTMISEMPNSRLRAYTIVLARGSYILVSVVTNQIIPRQLSAQEWNWGGKAGFFWFGTCFLSLLYTFFRIPETRNRSFLELDYLFHEKVKARAFRTYPIDMSKLAQADEANLDRDAYDEKTNESQIEVSQLPASNLAARHRPDHHTAGNVGVGINTHTL